MTIEKIKAVAKSAITWLTFLLLFLQVLIEELPGVVSEGVIGVIVRIMTWIGVAITIIRRTTTLPPNKRSIL